MSEGTRAAPRDSERTADAPNYIVPPSLAQELWQHAGKWVALNGESILAVEATYYAAFMKAQEAGSLEPRLHYVRDPKTRRLT